MKHKIYVASSWRNGYYPEVVTKLREAGHDVYDFRNPPSGDPGFKWSSVSRTLGQVLVSHKRAELESCIELGCGTSQAAEPSAYNSTEIENVI